jgi:hypothetical protein
MGDFDSYNNELMGNELSKEGKLGDSTKSDQDSIQNELDSGNQNSKNTSEPNSEGMMGMNEFDDYGQNMDIIMENIYENVTQTNNIFSSLGVQDDQDNDLSTIYSQENIEEVDNEFKEKILKKNKRSLKDVSELILIIKENINKYL